MRGHAGETHAQAEAGGRKMTLEKLRDVLKRVTAGDV
jgi:hypothetical protein